MALNGACFSPLPLLVAFFFLSPLIKCRSALLSALQLHPLLVLLEQKLLRSSKTCIKVGNRGRGLLMQRDLKSPGVLCLPLIVPVVVEEHGNYQLAFVVGLTTAPGGFC